MKKALIASLAISLGFPFTAPPVRAETPGGGPATVVTPSKEEQRIDKAPAIVTVVTSEDIERMGLRSLEDVLKRTVGFWTSTSANEDVIASRGMDADVNNNYLILLDGHRLNNVEVKGPGNQHILPLLSKVDRIEIVRGPGSTMWGDAAAFGVINIITKGAAAPEGTRVSADYSGKDRELDMSVLSKGMIGKNSHYLLSFTWFNSRGFAEAGGHPNVYHSAAPDVATAARSRDMDPSYEAYVKVTQGNLTVTARDLLWKEVDPSKSFTPDVTEWRHEHNFVELSHVKPLGGSGALETKLYMDQQFKATVRVDKATTQNVDNYEEKSMGGEAVLRGTLFEKHRVKVGARGARVESGDNTRLSVDAAGVIQGAAGTNLLVSMPGTDITRDLFAEDQFDATDKTTLILGGDLTYNSLRVSSARPKERGWLSAPRAGVVHALNDVWTAKYLYSAGFLIPDMSQGSNKFNAANASVPENTKTHSVQVSYQGAAGQANVVGFRTEVKDYIGMVGTGYANALTADIRGVEAEFRRKLAGFLSVYGNYAYAISKTNSDPYGFMNKKEGWIGMPHQLFNLGTDWSFRDNLTLNIHGRGWHDVVVNAYDPVLGAARLQPLSGQIYLDANLLYRKIAGTPLSASVYGTNLLNHGGRNPVQQVAGGWALEKGRSVGVKADYQF